VNRIIPSQNNKKIIFNLVFGIAKDNILCSFDSPEVALGAGFRQKCRWLLKDSILFVGRGLRSLFVLRMFDGVKPL